PAGRSHQGPWPRDSVARPRGRRGFQGGRSPGPTRPRHRDEGTGPHATGEFPGGSLPRLTPRYAGGVARPVSWAGPVPGSAPVPGAAGPTRPRAMRRASISVTVSRCPSTSTASPTAGNWPSTASTYPATVSYGPSGRPTPVCSANSSRFSRPSTSTWPPTSLRALSSSSYSSPMLPAPDPPRHPSPQSSRRPEARGAAVLVPHDRQVGPVAAHLRERRQPPLADRQPLNRPDHLADHECLARHVWVQQVTKVHEADHVVIGLLVHREPGVRRLRGARGGHRQRGVGGDDLHLAP